MIVRKNLKIALPLHHRLKVTAALLNVEITALAEAILDFGLSHELDAHGAKIKIGKPQRHPRRRRSDL